jgi:XRE family transcriptional regulator, regulator of sulfur utilization
MPVSRNRVSKQLGNTIRELRVGIGMTQATLAEKAGLQPNFIGEIERAEKLASVETLIRIANGLGMTGERLLGIAKL